MTELKPVIVLVDDETMAKLDPMLDEMVVRMEDRIDDPDYQRLLAVNGWSTRMIAWGQLVSVLAEHAGIDGSASRKDPA